MSVDELENLKISIRYKQEVLAHIRYEERKAVREWKRRFCLDKPEEPCHDCSKPDPLSPNEMRALFLIAGLKYGARITQGGHPTIYDDELTECNEECTHEPETVYVPGNEEIQDLCIKLKDELKALDGAEKEISALTDLIQWLKKYTTVDH